LVVFLSNTFPFTHNVLMGCISERILNVYRSRPPRESLRSLANTAKMNLHVNVPYGTNSHHIAEAIFKAFAIVGLPMILVLKQPDLGTTLTYMPILIVGLFLGGINVRQAMILTTAGIMLVAGAWSSGKMLKPYQKARLTSFINPDNDPKGSGYQIRQSLIAVGSGGIWGKGAAKGTQTQGDFLPIPHADFIFAAFGEEHGFVGAVFVLLLYFSILMRLIQNAQTAADLPGSLIIMGIVAVLTFQIAVNVGMVIGFMPVTGIPLPLMSYGGSSVLFTFLALGVVMNVRMRRFVN